MAAYPTLSVNPDRAGFREGLLEDPTLRSRMVNGTVLTRPRTTNVYLQWWFQYSALSQSDMNTLRTFQNTTVMVGSEVFTWAHPQTSTPYSCRFGTPLDIQLNEDEPGTYRVRVHLQQETA